MKQTLSNSHVRTTITLDRPLAAKLKRLAKERDTDVSKLIRGGLRYWLAATDAAKTPGRALIGPTPQTETQIGA